MGLPVELLGRLSEWTAAPADRAFPYRLLLAYVRSVGKHFIPLPVLQAVAAARDSLPAAGHNDPLLAPFLGVLLDKHEDRYDYATYTALSVLRIDTDQPAGECLRARDALVALLVADVVRFECEAVLGRHEELPVLRPAQELVRRRLRLAVRVLDHPLRRLGDAWRVPYDRWSGAAEPEALLAGANRVLAQDPGREPAGEIDRLALSMLPVYVMHDEYMFLRVLQSFEATFGMAVGLVRHTIAALRAGDADTAAALLAQITAVLRESAPLFSLLATMQVTSFRTFRAFTEGASAIQSENYKTLESLCARPAPQRLDSPAFRSTPAVRVRVLAGQDTVHSALQEAAATGRLGTAGLAQVAAAAADLDRIHLRWKQTHYSLAVRMLGAATGSGYTAGTPYLRSVLAFRLFPAFPTAGPPAPRSGPSVAAVSTVDGQS